MKKTDIFFYIVLLAVNIILGIILYNPYVILFSAIFTVLLVFIINFITCLKVEDAVKLVSLILLSILIIYFGQVLFFHRTIFLHSSLNILRNKFYAVTGIVSAIFIIWLFFRYYFLIKNTSLHNEKSSEIFKILDTSVIIDGRIVDILNLNFIDGIIVIPKFILKELQTISDSHDNLKRNRGRRGLDILNKIQSNPKIKLKIVNIDYPEIIETDEKLIALAKEFHSPLVTNDYNLNKVAELQSIQVLNINDLANALKPVMLPGEQIEILIIKEGKEHNQGIGYLNDGTMVVIDNANRQINQIVKAIVTSAIQTSAGRMIFGKKQEDLNK
ncbi:TRAM domain-containing protein [Candidatus Dependentiae bacterium]|nr:TRAM domain-containing protein [Candidatus Dependentiae bacterium]